MNRRTLIRILKNPRLIIRSLGFRNFFNWLSDDLYLKLIYRSTFNKKLNLDSPKNYNEKLQWLKINNRISDHTNYVDKLAVRSYISDVLGEEYLIPLIGVYDNVKDINWEMLPNQFVLKCTHGSGTNIISKNKKELNIKSSEKKLNKWMGENWFWRGREWPYKNIKPKIICEEFLVPEDESTLKDYRFFCFDGEVKFIAVDFDINNKENTKRNLYNLDWELMEAEISYPKNLNEEVAKPEALEEMIKVSQKLSEGISHVRVDLYTINKKIYFGEMTFYHQLGLANIYPEEFAIKMGEWIDLG